MVWNDAQSLAYYITGTLLFFMIIQQFFLGHTGQKIADFDPKWAFLDLTPVWNSRCYEMMYKAWSSTEEVFYCFSMWSIKFQDHTGQEIADFDPNWAFPYYNSRFDLPMALKWCTQLGGVYKRRPIVFERHPLNFKVTWAGKSTWIQF